MTFSLFTVLHKHTCFLLQHEVNTRPWSCFKSVRVHTYLFCNWHYFITPQIFKVRQQTIFKVLNSFGVFLRHSPFKQDVFFFFKRYNVHVYVDKKICSLCCIQLWTKLCQSSLIQTCRQNYWYFSLFIKSLAIQRHTNKQT